MGFFSRLGRSINRGVFQPVSHAVKEVEHAAKSVVEDIKDDTMKVGRGVVRVGEGAGKQVGRGVVKLSKEAKQLPKEIEDELDKIGKEIQILERKHKLLKHGGQALDIGLKGAALATANPELALLGSAVALGTNVASQEISK